MPAERVASGVRGRAVPGLAAGAVPEGPAAAWAAPEREAAVPAARGAPVAVAWAAAKAAAGVWAPHRRPGRIGSLPARLRPRGARLRGPVPPPRRRCREPLAAFARARPPRTSAARAAEPLP